VVTKNFLTYRFKQKHFQSGAKSDTTINVSCSTQILRTCLLTLGDMVNFFPLRAESHQQSGGKISQHVHTEKCHVIFITLSLIVLPNMFLGRFNVVWGECH
jgi:hypothetical protein